MGHKPEKVDFSLTDHLSIFVGRTIRIIHWILIEWWYEIPLARKEQKQFAREIRERLPFLFDQYDGEIIPNDRVPRPFGHSMVTVAIGRLLLRFGRGRGDFGIEIAAREETRDWRDWKDIGTVRMVLDESEERHGPVWLANLYDAERLLQAELPRLIEATSPDHWDLVKRKANAVFPAPLRIR